MKRNDRSKLLLDSFILRTCRFSIAFLNSFILRTCRFSSCVTKLLLTNLSFNLSLVSSSLVRHEEKCQVLSMKPSRNLLTGPKYKAIEKLADKRNDRS